MIYTYKTFPINNTAHYANNIRDYLVPGTYWESSMSELRETHTDGDKVFEYEFPNRPVILKIEPNNIYHPGAIRIEYNEDCIGYVTDEDTDTIQMLMEKPNYDHATCRIEWGNYFELYEDEETERLKKRRDYSELSATLVLAFRTVYAQPQEKHTPTRKKRQMRNKGLFVFARALSVLLVVLGLLILIVTPIGIAAIIFGIVMFFVAKMYAPASPSKHGKQK